MENKIKRLSSTLGDSLDLCAAIRGNGTPERSELKIWTNSSSIRLRAKEIVDLFYLISKGFNRKILYKE